MLSASSKGIRASTEDFESQSACSLAAGRTHWISRRPSRPRRKRQFESGRVAQLVEQLAFNQ